MPLRASCSLIAVSCRRSPKHQAPPCSSTTAGKDPAPRGLNRRASKGVSPWRRYSTSSTSTSYSKVLSAVAAMSCPPFHQPKGLKERLESNQPTPTIPPPGQGEGLRAIPELRRATSRLLWTSSFGLSLSAVFHRTKAVQPICLVSLASRHDFLGKQFHRAPDRGVINQPALIEVGNELLHRELLTQRIDAAGAIVRITKNPKVAVNSLKRRFLHALLKLLIGFKGLDRSIGQRLDQLPGHAEKMHQALLTFAARLLPIVRNVNWKGQRHILLRTLEAITMHIQIFA